MDNRAFLGAGMSFPPRIDPGTGRFAVSAGARSVKESVYLLLMTNQGERWLEPGFGSRMMSYTFMDASHTVLKMLSDDLREMLLRQEPRIGDVEVSITPEDRKGTLLVDIGYTIAASNSRENLVFPFYLNAVAEEELDEAR